MSTLQYKEWRKESMIRMLESMLQSCRESEITLHTFVKFATSQYVLYKYKKLGFNMNRYKAYLRRQRNDGVRRVEKAHADTTP
jgi:hypothetical protein